MLVLCKELVVADFDGDADALQIPVLLRILLPVAMLLLLIRLLLLLRELKLELPRL